MMISTKGRYALSTLIDIAEQEKKGNPVSIKEVAERQGISVKYLEYLQFRFTTLGLYIEYE